MSTPPSDFKKDLKHMLTQYLASLIKYKKGDTNVQEFEVRFKPHNKLFFDKYFLANSRLPLKINESFLQIIIVG